MNKLIYLMALLNPVNCYSAQINEGADLSSIKSVIISFIVIIVFMLLRFYKKKVYLHNIKSIDVLSVKHISFKSQLVLVKVNDKEILLGVTANSIHCLEKYEDEVFGRKLNHSTTTLSDNYEK